MTKTFTAIIVSFSIHDYGLKLEYSLISKYWAAVNVQWGLIESKGESKDKGKEEENEEESVEEYKEVELR